jgi:MoaA/NifB/PqqE/SkfB family radical SAM enzyme
MPKPISEEEKTGIFGGFLWFWLKGILYKHHSFSHRLTLKKAFNLFKSLISYALKTEQVNYLPPVLKIDLSPLCNLHCPICVHATPREGSNLLNQQAFNSDQRMPVEEFRNIISQVAGKTQAVYLYLMGEPFMHPEFCTMSRIAHDAGLNVLVSSHFSFKFSDRKIEEIAHSGITHLELSIDGPTQEIYEQTRVGGNLEHVFYNLERLSAYKKEHGLKYPKIEVQCLTFEHNRDHVEQLKQRLEPYDIDKFTDEHGDVGSWAEMAAENFNVLSPKPNLPIPTCHWPYAAMVIKYDGDVIPCCLFNMGKQFAKEPDRSMVLGNAFEQSVAEIWDGKPYRDLRKYVSKPELVLQDKSLEKTYCYGCPQVCSTELKETVMPEDGEFIIRTNR